MSIITLFLIAVGLSMDAFAVSICKGLATPQFKIKNALTVGIWFGGFQALMPMVGFFLGSRFEQYIVSIDHWIAFALLGMIGINMIRESFSEKEENETAAFDVKTMLILAIATSIDALAIGISFALLHVRIVYAALFIGITTFILSALGLLVGNVFGTRYKAKSELLGGIILILIGFKILCEHLGLIGA
ncbi:MAG: manganese efflux pump MntP family protein [Lachnospiraceae bacterium]|nr:manganese efflux pump MntP family protein [Lachnospiraceae bacterium]